MDSELTWEQEQDTLDYRQWKAEQELEAILDAAIRRAQMEWKAEHEARLYELSLDKDTKVDGTEWQTAVANWHAARDAWNKEVE